MRSGMGIDLTEKDYEARYGMAPMNDDLQRANCRNVGQTGHWYCGECSRCRKPRFACGHMIRDTGDHDQAAADAHLIAWANGIESDEILFSASCASAVEQFGRAVERAGLLSKDAQAVISKQFEGLCEVLAAAHRQQERLRVALESIVQARDANLGVVGGIEVLDIKGICAAIEAARPLANHEGP